ncbi:MULTISPECIES: hypothetical protein [Streptomyces]|uniref:Uncharacterized protein n=1 Tax=Streptomyces caniscabiei TaxID=2746961 RepID=A0A927KYL2_9ACTN|nr:MULTISPECIES: hypothetical protein [Streptomyces]MBD9722470.1 hypothetical protein [Streptomyces caniscabiei]MDX3515140.1 hypothetical protein [Streptomyces caniscabiei]MDX3638232.1 hypothetical protein [Streptomyces sp. MB09-02B]MDX3716578.1 hypothetical protein [Streptomyces caniscabiei]MDX3731986.1 hypothetical protein [Streptomyces caniscabiei]
MSAVLNKSRSIAVCAAIVCGVFGAVLVPAEEAQAINVRPSVSCPSGTTWNGSACVG